MPPTSASASVGRDLTTRYMRHTMNCRKRTKNSDAIMRFKHFSIATHSLPQIFFIACILACWLGSSEAATLVGYTEKDVWNYVRTMPRENLTAKCGSSLDRVEVYLTDRSTLEEQRKFYYESYSTGDATQFISRDQDRWLFSAFKCIKSAGETSYSASEYPMHYCYGYNAENPQTAYGVCIPSTCSNDRIKLLREWQALASKDKDNQPLDYEDCTQSRHSRQWYEQLVPLIHFSSDIVLVIIVGLATVYHLKRGEKDKSMAIQFLLAFSMKRNIYKLIQMPKDSQSTITCMFGLRFLSMAWTLVGHSFIFVQAFLENVDAFKDDLVDNFWNQWITNFTLSVDVFLTLSGCLTAYTWFRKWQRNTTEQEPGWDSWAYWLRFYRHRVIRLWPAYIYTLVAVTTRVSITHYHPMWPPTDPAVQCPKHWWENVLFINSLTDNRCMPWTWYIGTEFIYYLVSPIFLLTLRRNPAVGLGVSAGVIGISAILNIITMANYNFPPTQMLWKQPAIFSPDFILHHLKIYIKPQYRIGPYVVGILLGYYLAGFQTQTQKKQRSSRFVVFGWAMALIAGFWSIFGLYPSLQGWNWPLYHYVYGASSRTVFSLSLGWIIYACHTGIGAPLNVLLSWSPLLPLSILSYSVYLIHMIPVVFTYILAPFPMYFTTKWHILAHCVIQLAISYCFGILCTFVAELPALNIERILLSRKDKRGTKLKPLSIPTSDCEVQLRSAEVPSQKC
ncbi:acyltransferase family domain-containing protein [Ditylenchus destructor]|nr:acyltransferase family domain-containing protein [Ditylenchus destructor]